VSIGFSVVEDRNDETSLTTISKRWNIPNFIRSATGNDTF